VVRSNLTTFFLPSYIKHKIPHAMTKEEFKEWYSNQDPRNVTEKYIHTHFIDIYSEIQEFAMFPDGFKFPQKLYHYLNNDPDLLLGICPECGKRCGFINMRLGYRAYCSVKCSSNSKDVRKKFKETCLERYGDDNYNNRSKFKETCLGRYGVEYASQSEEVKHKIKETCLDRYGVENPLQNIEIREKYKQTCLKKYGKESFFQTDKFKEKYRETCLERYGVEYAFQSEEVKSKIKETCLDRYGVENYSKSDEYRDKVKETCLERYGVENYSKSDEFKNKAKETCLEKYGTENYSKSDEFKEKFNDIEWVRSINEKSYQTKKANNSFNTSKIEDQLKEYFDSNNINYISQYKSDLYPFNCDFYFPDKDLYVEIQGSWTHGTHPFTGSEEDMNNLNLWESKGTKYYENAIEVWTIRDVEKREKAKKNNLNYLEIFSCDLETCLNEINHML